MKEELSDEKVLVKIRYRKLILPSTYNVSEGDSLVLTMSACTLYGLALYTNDKWISIRDKLLKAGTSNTGKLSDITRYLISNAESYIVENGGIRISPILFDAAGLKREAIWIQRSNRIEIWNPKVAGQCASLLKNPDSNFLSDVIS